MKLLIYALLLILLPLVSRLGAQHREDKLAKVEPKYHSHAARIPGVVK